MLNFSCWLESQNADEALQQVITKVFGRFPPDDGVYWVPFLDKTVYAQLRQADNVSDTPYVLVAFFNTDDLGTGDLSTVHKTVQSSTLPFLRKLQEFGSELSKAGLRMVYTAESRKTVDGWERPPTQQRASLFNKVFSKAGMSKLPTVQDGDDEYHRWQ